MKFKCEIEINLPRVKVIELFDEPDNLSKWQPELISFSNISGTPGQVGAQSKLVYKMGKREIEMTETITKRNMSDEFDGTYEAKRVFNKESNRFVQISDSKTKWISENEFNFNGFISLLALFMPGAFKNQSMKYLEMFKEFAESGLK